MFCLFTYLPGVHAQPVPSDPRDVMDMDIDDVQLQLVRQNSSEEDMEVSGIAVSEYCTIYI